MVRELLMLQAASYPFNTAPSDISLYAIWTGNNFTLTYSETEAQVEQYQQDRLSQRLLVLQLLF